jgi:hypothetical protein
MKVSAAPCKIKAILLGEAALNLIRVGQTPLKAKFALLDSEGNSCGSFEKSDGWSDAALEALSRFAEVLETEALGVVFEASEVAEATGQDSDGPPQF